MNILQNMLPSQKLLMGFALCLLSVLMAAYAPMSLHSEARAIENNAVAHLKERLTTEINRQISGLKTTLSSINIEAKSDSSSASATVTSDAGNIAATAVCDTSETQKDSDTLAGATLSFEGGTLTGAIVLPCSMVDQVKGFIEKGVDGLKDLLNKVKDAVSLENLQKLVQSVADSLRETIVTSVQGLLTSAVASVTGVLDKIKAAFNDISSRVTQLGQCLFGNEWSISTSLDLTKSEGLKAGVTANPTAKDGSEEVAGGENCKEVEASISSQDVIDAGKKLMEVAKPVIQMGISIVMSVVALLPSIISSLTGILSGSGNIGGIMTVFTSALSQLGNVTSMLGNVSSLFGGLNL